MSSLLPEIARGPFRMDALDVIDAPTEVRQDSQENPMTSLGSFADKGQAARPRQYTLYLNDRERSGLYTSNGLAKKIVDFYPVRATRKGWSVPDLPDEDQRLGTWTSFRQGFIWARLDGGAVGLPVVIDDVPDAFRNRPMEWLREPLDLDRVQEVKAFHVYDAQQAQPLQYDDNIQSPGYGLPLLWSITAPGIRAVVHASRVIHFRGVIRPPSLQRGGFGRSSNMPDDSVLQAIWDQIRDLTSVMQGGAHLAQEMRQHVLKIANLQEKLVGDQAGSLQSRLKLMLWGRGALGMDVISDGDSYEVKANPVTGYRELSAEAKSMLSAVSNIPQMQLFGESPTGLANDGEGNHESLRQAISDYQEEQRETLTRFYRILFHAKKGPTRGKEPASWALVYNQLDEPDAKKVAETRLIIAQTDAAMIGSGVYGARDVAISRFGPDGYRSEMEPVEPPDEDAELEARVQAEVERQAAEAPEVDEDAEEDEDEEPSNVRRIRGDADTKPPALWLMVPAPDPKLIGAASSALGQPLAFDGLHHITLLYMGSVSEDDTAEVVEAVREVAKATDPIALDRGTLRTFPAGEDGTPVIVEFEAWGIEGLQSRLLRALAHRILVRQHARFRPHVTVGYAASPIEPDAMSALLGVDASDLRVAVTEIRVMRGDEVVATVAVGS